MLVIFGSAILLITFSHRVDWIEESVSLCFLEPYRLVFCSYKSIHLYISFYERVVYLAQIFLYNMFK